MTAASQPPAPSHAHDRQDQPFISLGVGIVTVSDSRTLETDRSGKLLEDTLQAAGHRCVLRTVVPDVVKQIQAQVNDFLADDRVHTILVTGGTGVTPRDVTPEALQPLFEKTLSGFGELFRALSFQEIGAASIQSRATAGVANGKVIWALPGSTGACRLALESIILPQLDNRTSPCSFTGLLFTD
jgi:molybdenum cofactor biosynthesis protein B